MRISAEETAEHRSVGDRMLLILDTVAAAPGELGLSELARQTGLKKATVHRLAADLVAHRMLERGGYGYRLGLHLFELGQQVPASRRLRATALPFMADLLAATGEVVQLGVLDGTEIVYVEKLTGRHSVPVPSSVGSRLPAYCTGLGKAILAFEDESAIELVLAAPMPARTSTTITDGKRLLRELETIRDSGVAYDREEGTKGIACVAAPIIVESYVGRGGHRAVAGLSVTGPAQRLHPERLAAAVRTAALSISRLLGPPSLR
ncbi:IclR family transcriptional regulator [Kutzneria sp. CA-103260]|uniref:IclR family transcriptional regulator n=1 Tax=Kutzneria sp. CA-103260 TaxID=2802641 RepID=UPI001BF0077E|nr:IclR family transcriptional regulator [Kutzneria sp. CA-103260]QUQ72426.1 IclR family transcriptional regulator [Kutzneria sp. CA-103260]